jgi:hypothetical protein
MKLMAVNMIAMLLVFAGITVYNFRTEETGLITKGLHESVKYFLMILIIVSPLALIAGQVKVMYGKNPETVRKVISGKFGIYKALAVGIFVPGGMAAGPVFQEEWKKGGTRFAILVLLLASTMLNWTGIFTRLPFLGWRITALMFGVSAIMLSSMIFSIVLYQRFGKQ